MGLANNTLASSPSSILILSGESQTEKPELSTSTVPPVSHPVSEMTKGLPDNSVPSRDCCLVSVAIITSTSPVATLPVMSTVLIASIFPISPVKLFPNNG